MGWIDLLNKPINSFCYNIRINLNYGEKVKELKTKFPEIFYESLGRCKKKSKSLIQIEKECNSYI